MENKNFGTLYVAATPIGNLEDITYRVARILGQVEWIVCEDSRVSSKLLAHLGIKKPMIIYNDHSGDMERDVIINKLINGDNIAIISDAGTPLVSDPGYKLIRDCQSHNIKISPVPGPSALTAALSICGIAGSQFYFGGFLEPKAMARRKQLEHVKSLNCSIVLYETARRIIATLHDLRDILGDREVALCRELTKAYEEIIRLPIDWLIDNLENRDYIKGEIVIVISPPQKGSEEYDSEFISSKLKILMKDHSTKEAIAIVSDQFGISKKRVYKQALELKNEN